MTKKVYGNEALFIVYQLVQFILLEREAKQEEEEKLLVRKPEIETVEFKDVFTPTKPVPVDPDPIVLVETDKIIEDYPPIPTIIPEVPTVVRTPIVYTPTTTTLRTVR